MLTARAYLWPGQRGHAEGLLSTNISAENLRRIQRVCRGFSGVAVCVFRPILGRFLLTGFLECVCGFAVSTAEVLFVGLLCCGTIRCICRCHSEGSKAWPSRGSRIAAVVARGRPVGRTTIAGSCVGLQFLTARGLFSGFTCCSNNHSISVGGYAVSSHAANAARNFRITPPSAINSMPPVVYDKPTKARSNPRLERLKDRIRCELKRPLTAHEEHLIELSAALLNDDYRQDDVRSDAA